MKLSGSPIIKDNTAMSNTSNLWLNSGQTVIIDGGLTKGADIGVSTATSPTSGPVSITGECGTDYSSYFHPDNEDFEIRTSEDSNKVQLAMKTWSGTHSHFWVYINPQSRTDTIQADCTSGGNCDAPYGTTTVAIEAPKNTTYDGTEKGATLFKSENWEKVSTDDITITYQKDNNGSYEDMSGTPIEAGKYKASITVGKKPNVATAYVVYEISNRLALTGTPTFTPVTEAGKTIADVTLTAPTGWPEGKFYWMKGEAGLNSTTPITQGTSYEWVFIPTDIDNYQSIGGELVLWNDTSGGSSSNPGGGSSGGGSSSNSGGGSSGGGNASGIGNSNNGSSNANIPATPVTVPVSGDEKTIQVNAAVRDTTATIQNVDLSKLNTVIGDTVKTGVVTIDFSALKKVDTVKLPSNVVNQFAAAVNDPNNHAKGLEIVLTNGTSVELGAGVLGEKNVQAKGTDITLSIKRITDINLNIMQKLTVGDRPAWDINVTLGGKPISNINGKATVSAAYELKPGEQSDGIVVYYVDENGSKQLCETSYDPVKKQVSWQTDPLFPSSIFMIGYDENRVKPDTGSYVTYTIQKGNTLSRIARKYGCTVAEILEANSGLIRNPNRIHVGWQLKIPQD